MHKFRRSQRDRESGLGASFVESEDEFEDPPARGRGKDQETITCTMAKAEVSLHMYSGYPKDTRYDVGAIERYTAEAWCSRLEMVASSAGWSEKSQAANAALALVPGSPADRWFQVVKEEAAIKTWAGFKQLFLAEFSPEETVMEKIALLNSMTQEKNERVNDFKNKLTGKMERFKAGMDPIWTKYAADEADKAELKAHRENVLADVIDYLSRLMFVNGLDKELQLDVAKSEAKSLTEMIKIACKSEAAIQAVRGPKKPSKPVAAMTDETPPSIKEQVAAMVAAELEARAKAGAGQGASKSKKDKKRKNTDLSKIGCYYCLEMGHFASDCEAKKKDREADIWRPTIKDPKMTRAEFYALTPEQRNKGKELMKNKPAQSSGGVAGIEQARPREDRSQIAYWMTYNSEN